MQTYSKEPTPLLGYIFGALCGDAYLEGDAKRGVYGIVLKTPNKDYADLFACILEDWSGYKVQWRPISKPKKGTWKPAYRVMLQGKEFLNYFRQYFEKQKTFTWKVPKIILSANEEVKKGFLVGFFDAEGFCYLYKGYMTVGASSANLLGLKQVQELLKEMGIHSRIQKTFTGHYELRIRRKESIDKFMEKVGFGVLSKIEKADSLWFKAPLAKPNQGERYKIIFNLFRSGMSYKEIASRLGITALGVGSLLSYARRRINLCNLN